MRMKRNCFGISDEICVIENANQIVNLSSINQTITTLSLAKSKSINQERINNIVKWERRKTRLLIGQRPSPSNYLTEMARILSCKRRMQHSVFSKSSPCLLILDSLKRNDNEGINYLHFLQMKIKAYTKGSKNRRNLKVLLTNFGFHLRSERNLQEKTSGLTNWQRNLSSTNRMSKIMRSKSLKMSKKKKVITRKKKETEMMKKTKSLHRKNPLKNLENKKDPLILILIARTTQKEKMMSKAMKRLKIQNKKRFKLRT